MILRCLIFYNFYNYPCIYALFHVEGPKDSNLSNEVFEDFSSGEYYDHPEEEDIPEVPEEEEKNEVSF